MQKKTFLIDSTVYETQTFLTLTKQYTLDKSMLLHNSSGYYKTITLYIYITIRENY